MNDMTDLSTTERVKTRLDGQVLHIRFNNPAKHNALSVDMWEAVPPLLERAAKDDNVRMVVFSGEGEKAFVSGADISQFEDMRAAQEAVKRYEQMAEAALEGIYEFEKPTLACIRGYCIGGGVNVAISCDIRIATTTSIVFGARLAPRARLPLLRDAQPHEPRGPGVREGHLLHRAPPRRRGGAAHRPRQPHRRAREARRSPRRIHDRDHAPARRSPSRPASTSSARC